jgi:hypothetical protein
MATEEVKAPDNQSVVGHVHPDKVAEVEAAAAAATSSQPADQAAPASTTAATVSSLDPPAPAVEAAAPAAPAVSTGEKVATGIEIGLTDVSAVAKIVSEDFAGTPVAAIAKLLGPLAGLGAAVLAQHLAHRGFDLSTLKDAEIL